MGLLWRSIVAITWLLTGMFGILLGFLEVIETVTGGIRYGVIGGAITAIIFKAAARLIGGITIDLA